EGPGERRIAADDRLPIRGEQPLVRPLGPASRLVEGVSGDHSVEALNLFSGDRLPHDHHLETVELRRIVRPGDLQAPIDLEGVRREIESGSRTLADVHGTAARGDDAGADLPSQLGPRGPVIASDGEHWRPR